VYCQRSDGRLAIVDGGDVGGGLIVGIIDGGTPGGGVEVVVVSDTGRFADVGGFGLFEVGFRG